MNCTICKEPINTIPTPNQKYCKKCAADIKRNETKKHNNRVKNRYNPLKHFEIC